MLAKGTEILEVLEFERFFNLKNSGMCEYKYPQPELVLSLMHQAVSYLYDKYGVDRAKYCFYDCGTFTNKEESTALFTTIPAQQHIHCLHHLSHASGCFYQSPFEEAIVFTMDGGGNDGVFLAFHCVRGQEPKYIKEFYYDLGYPYMLFGQYLMDIKKEVDLSEGNLVYSGKVMGLVSYGKAREDWLPHFINFYKSRPWSFTYRQLLDNLSKEIGVTFDDNKRLTGQVAYDVAATSQRAFEEVMLECIRFTMQDYPNLPIGLSGGCALNILANTRVKKEIGREVFIGPGPSDCGIALGMMLSYLKPAVAYDATYSGLELLDKHSLSQQLVQLQLSYQVERGSIVKLAHLIAQGRIIGVARGRSEHGPRALGNRSIICNPAIASMKDILNAKVKHREWYRPFAPIVREHDVDKYFEWMGESRWMSFAPNVREEFKTVLPSITHVDGTARVQTVTRDQNPFIFDLISEVANLTGIGVLLNTSFNVDGKPILSTVRDALQILQATDIDGVLIEDTLVYK